MTDVSLTPYLSPHDCAAAIAFYEKAFGAVETGARFTDPEGRIGHSEITIGGATIYLSDEFPDFGACSPQSLGGSSAALHIRVADADETARRLVAAGARSSTRWPSRRTASAGERSWIRSATAGWSARSSKR